MGGKIIIGAQNVLAVASKKCRAAECNSVCFLSLFFFLHIFEAESCIVSAGLEVAIIAQAGLELLIFLPQTPKC